LAETTRQWISDLDAKILADAYGYSVVLPSTFNTAHVTLDSLTGTLLIQGGVTSQGLSFNDSVVLDVIGSDIRVSLFRTGVGNYATEMVPSNLVQQIVISRAGDSTLPTISSSITVPRTFVYSVVSSNQDAVDTGSLSDGFVDLNTVVPGAQVTLRAAIQNTNGNGGGSIYVPRGKYQLTLTGAGGDAQGDLDILKSTTIIGTGAGETIVDAGGDSGIQDRVFEVVGSPQPITLTLDSLTVTGGKAPMMTDTPWLSHGGGILVGDNTYLVSNNSAVVGNKTTNESAAIGGGIFFTALAGGAITNSVITQNYSASYVGGVYLGGGTAPFRPVSVTGSIIAKNTARLPPLGSQYSYDVGAEATNRDFTSGGNNRIGPNNPAVDVGFTAASDYMGNVHYVVTGVADTYTHSDDDRVTSIREAIDLANTTSGAQEIWLPAWKFKLTRERNSITQLTDMDVSFGDLDIADALTIRGVSGSTSVTWRAGAASDAVFDLLGDYNGDGITSADNGVVDSGDYVIWAASDGSTNLQADGNDDGVVNSLDYDVYRSRFGNTLTLLNVA
jgi:hypothetical protein